jgi:hypothetical protein
VKIHPDREVFGAAAKPQKQILEIRVSRDYLAESLTLSVIGTRAAGVFPLINIPVYREIPAP